jgi:hypothetical protein
MERALAEIAAEVKRIDPLYPDVSLTKLQNRLRNKGKFKNLFR